MDKKLVIFNYIILLFSIIVFGEYLINFATYSSSYILFLLFFILLSLHVFVTGILVNKEKIYKQNIKLYLILYVVLLISLTVFINRPNFALFDANFLKTYAKEINFIPFKTIVHFLFDNVNWSVKLYNIVGNLIALMPLSFLLIIFNKRYSSYKEQLKILFIIVLGIEFCQFILSAGRLDIDDFILNIVGAMIFFTIIKKAKLIEPLRNFFHGDLNIPKMTKYIILIFVSVAIIVMDILFIIDLNREGYGKFNNEYFSVIPINERCADMKRIELDGYDLYIDCVDVLFAGENDYYYSLEEALRNRAIDLNHLDKYFNVVEYADNVVVYRNNDLTMFRCNTNNNKDIYVGGKDMVYNDECN